MIFLHALKYNTETMPELGDAVASVRRTVSKVKSRVATVLTKLGITAALAIWVLSWSILARLHYTLNDYVSAVFTTAVFVGPGLAVLAWYVGEQVGYDVPTPTVDGDLISS